MITKTVAIPMTVSLPRESEEELLHWMRVTYGREDVTLDDAIKALVRELTFLGERYAGEELEGVVFMLSSAEEDE